MELSVTLQRLMKADFLHGVGIAVGRNDVSFAHMTKRFMTVSLRHARTVSLPESGRERLDEFDHTLNNFLQDIDTIPDQVVLSLPRHMAYVSRVVVPESARDMIHEVIGYQADQLLPFPKEDLYYDYLTSEVGQEEKRIEVTVFGFSRREVEEYLGILLQAQLRPQMVTLSCSSLTNTLTFCGPPPVGPRLLLVPEDASLEMNSINGSRLLASQVIPIALEIEKRELDEFVAQIVTRNFPGVSPTETPLFSCFAAARLPFTVSAERDLQALATLQFGLNEGDVLPPPTLPALGAALQAIGEGNGGINLLPEEQRARREKRLSPFTLALVGAVGMLGIVWATVAIFQQHRILRDLARQRAALEAPVQQVQTQEEEMAQLQKQLQLLDGAGRQKAIPVLKGLSELFPKEYYLNHLRYKEGDIEMSGLGSQSAADLLAQLENSPCFRDVTAKAPFTTTPQGETFTLGAKTELCRE